jgi:hypothetical protein
MSTHPNYLRVLEEAEQLPREERLILIARLAEGLRNATETHSATEPQPNTRWPQKGTKGTKKKSRKSSQEIKISRDSSTKDVKDSKDVKDQENQEDREDLKKSGDLRGTMNRESRQRLIRESPPRP